MRGRRGLAALAAAAGASMLVPLECFAQITDITWAAPAGSTQDWEVNSNWSNGSQYPNSNTDLAAFTGAAAASLVDLTLGDTVNELVAQQSAQSYTFENQGLTIDINRTSSAGMAMDVENAAGTTITFNNNVSVINTGAGTPSQVQISQQFGPAASGTLTFNGTLTVGGYSAPTVLLPENGGVININGGLSVGTDNYLCVEAPGGTSGGAVNINQNNGATATGIDQLVVGGSATNSNTVNVEQNLTLEAGSGIVWMDYTPFLTYSPGNNNLYLTGNGITLNVASQSIRFDGSATATDTITVGSNYSGGGTTNTIDATTINLANTTGDAQTYVFFAAANNTLNLGNVNIFGSITTEEVEFSGAGAVEENGKSTASTPFGFSTLGGTLEIAGSSDISGGAIIKGPAGLGTFNITNGTIEDNGSQTISNAITLGGSATFEDATVVDNTPGLIFSATSGGSSLTTANSFTLTANSALTVDNTTGIFESITDGGKGYGLTVNGPGELVLTATNSYSGTTSVNSATLLISSSRALPTGGNVVNNGTLQIAAASVAGNVSGASGITIVSYGGSFQANAFTQSGVANYGVLQVNGAGSIGQIIGSGSLIVGSGTSTNTVKIIAQPTPDTSENTQSSLTINTGAALDVTDNLLQINYADGADPIATIIGYLKSGYAGGAWNGAGINSSVAAANSLSYGVGYADSADPGNPAGLSSGTIEVEYTLLGDVNLDGVVNGTDFGILAANFNKGVTNWDQGDFNFGSTVNGTDFGELAMNFNKGVAGNSVGAPAYDEPALLAFAAASGLLADVPEPASVGLLMLGAAATLARRRRGVRRGILWIVAAAISAVSLGNVQALKAQVVAPPAGEQWSQTFADNFNEGSLSLAGWTYDLGGGGWENDELETYTNSPSNVFVSGGALHIDVIASGPAGEQTYTSGRIRTSGLFSQTYGLFEFTAKFPVGVGLEAGVGMFPENPVSPTGVGNSAYGTWPNSGEIDIDESPNISPNTVFPDGVQNTLVQGSLHSGTSADPQNQHGAYTDPAGFTTAAWHTYDVEWNPPSGGKPGAINYYCDGNLYFSVSSWDGPSNAGSDEEAPFDQPFYFMTNVAVGGNFGGANTPDLADGTYDFEIGYMRAYEQQPVSGESAAAVTVPEPTAPVVFLLAASGLLLNRRRGAVARRSIL